MISFLRFDASFTMFFFQFNIIIFYFHHSCPEKFHLDEYVLLLCFGTAIVIAHPTFNREL